MSDIKFQVELIKPSHYDDDGYLIQWWRGFVPSSSLSNLYGLALDAQNRRILGAGVDLEIEAHDETNKRVPVRSIIRRFKRNSNRGYIATERRYAAASGTVIIWSWPTGRASYSRF